jgi:polyribonucleotide nucleotidyltransferase
MEAAKAAILAIVDPPKAELGKIYTGRVVNITKFGAFVNILPGRDGLEQ